ncbi:unnamed protein product [Triticum turgidum subsp. durum]|uniref:Uncharacterized protein n=1 Tax=Triticum turgidum subsp. durum TaxID=4567 RepID=A0A9R0YSA8_TRITD|nr:unnamed protein product [Triticum turgidum subsp. durum]
MDPEEKTLIVMYTFCSSLVHLGSKSRWTRRTQTELLSASASVIGNRRSRRVLPPEPRTTSRLLPVPTAQQPSKLMDLDAHHRQ